MSDNSVFFKFKVVDTLRSPLMPGQSFVPNAQEKEMLLEAVRSMRIEPRVIHSVSIDYLSSMKASSDDVARAIVETLQTNKEFEQGVFQAAREAIVFSMLAVVLLPEAYRFALTALAPLKWPQVQKMRKSLFMVGIDMLMEDIAGDRVRVPVAKTNAESFLCL